MGTRTTGVPWKRVSIAVALVSAVLGVLVSGRELFASKTQPPPPPAIRVEVNPSIHVEAPSIAISNGTPSPIPAAAPQGTAAPRSTLGSRHGRESASLASPGVGRDERMARPGVRSPPRPTDQTSAERSEPAVLPAPETSRPEDSRSARPSKLTVGGRAVASLSGAAYTRMVFDAPHGSKLAQRRLKRGELVSIDEIRPGWARITWADSTVSGEGTSGGVQSGWVEQSLLDPR
jgi:hypothetical protein